MTSLDTSRSVYIKSARPPPKGYIMEDTFPDETIMIVKRWFPGAERTYTYVVSKIAGRWFVTGHTESGKGRSWDELISWLAAGKIVDARIAATFERVVML